MCWPKDANNSPRVLYEIQGFKKKKKKKKWTLVYVKNHNIET